MKFFWILWGFDALISFIVLYFFTIGLADGSVSSFNAEIWLLVLGVVGAVMLGSWWLQSRRQMVLAYLLLCVLALPGLLYGLFLVAIMSFGGRWN